jgi:endonuclease-3 related protein
MAHPALRDRLLALYRHLLRHFGPQGWWPARSRFEVIVGAILAQNTAWNNVQHAIAALRAEGLLTPRAIDALPLRTLARLVRPSRYYTTKARRLKAFTDFLRERHAGSLRRMFRMPTSALRQELLGVSGIGEETADSILLYAGNHAVFVVDAYTRRILARHGLIRADARYRDMQQLFMRHLPAHPALFNEYHALLVAVGKTYCRATPRCEVCPLRDDLPGAIRPSVWPRADYTRPRTRSPTRR